MGGTGVALGRDGSIPFLNPAGLTRVEGGTVSFNSNFFSLAHTKYDRFFQPACATGASLVGNRQIESPSYTQNRLDGVPSSARSRRCASGAPSAARTMPRRCS